MIKLVYFLCGQEYCMRNAVTFLVSSIRSRVMLVYLVTWNAKKNNIDHLMKVLCAKFPHQKVK